MASGAGTRVRSFSDGLLGQPGGFVVVCESPFWGLFLLEGSENVKRDAFSSFHPAVNFLFFMGAIGFGVVIQHPAYLAAGAVCGFVYYLLLHGWKGLKLLLAVIPMFLLIMLVNPLINTYGKTVLFTYFGRNWTLEAMVYGMVLGGMFVLMMVWFGCYSVVLTSDKFVCLFGSLIPALSLLLVMVLRLIPSFLRKTKQIIGARNAIGKGGNENASFRDKAASGMTVLSALTDWALEGSIVTADSMRARGYGSAKRTSFRIYRMTARDWVVLAVELVLAVTVIVTIAAGGTEASFTYRISVSPLTWGYMAYWAFLLIPTVIQIKEEIQWRIILSKI